MSAVNFIYLVWETAGLPFCKCFLSIRLSAAHFRFICRSVASPTSAAQSFRSSHAYIRLRVPSIQPSNLDISLHLHYYLWVFGLLSFRFAAHNQDLWQFELIPPPHVRSVFLFTLYFVFAVSSFRYRKFASLLKLYVAKSKYKIRLDELLLPVFCRISAWLSVLCTPILCVRREGDLSYRRIF